MWDNVVLDFGEEETINFGPRLEITGTNHLYEVHTVATISPSAKVNDAPPIATHSSQEFIAIAVDNCVTVFKNECSDLWLNLNFDTKVEQIALSPDSQLLLIGEHNGKLHIYYLPGRHEALEIPLITPVDNSESFKSILIVPEHDSSSTNKATLIVLGHEQLFVFYHLNMDHIRNAAVVEDWSGIQQHLMSAKRVQFPLSELLPQNNVEMVFHVDRGSKQLLLGYCGSGLHPLGVGSVDYSDISFSLKEDSGIHFQKVEVTSDGVHIFALDNNNVINIICSKTLITAKILKTKVISDFSLVEATDPRSGAVVDRKLVCLSSVDGGQILEILQFPSLSIIYSLKMSSTVHLLKVLSNQENFYVIEGVWDEVENSNVITSLRVRQISEALPEARLAQLLRKRKYDEAEKFALLYNLDVQDVYQAKSVALMDSLSLWLPEPLAMEASERALFQLKSLLKKIKDLRFLVEICLNSTPSTLKFTEDLLLYARESVIQREVDNWKSVWLKQINESLNRLATFQKLYPSETEWCGWFRFKQCNLLQEFLQLLKNEKTAQAFVLWERHTIELCDVLTDDIIQEIILCIPENIPSEELSTWLQDSFLVPVLISSHSSIEELAKWMVQRARILELSEKDGWPENSLHLLQVLPDTCEMLSTCEQGGPSVVTELSLHLLQRKAVAVNSSFSALLALIMDLKELVILRRNYKCLLSLAEFCQEDKLSVVFLILKWLVGTKHMDEAVTSYLTRFIKSASLDVDFVFSLYIKDILAEFPVGWWWHWEEAPWEERVLHILKYIHNPNVKLSATLDILSQAPVPWSPAISALVEEQLENGKGKAELEMHKRLAGLKLVLAKYSIRNYNITDVQAAERLMRFILEQSKPTALEDALVVASSISHFTESDAYFMQEIRLLENNKMDDFGKLLKKMSEQTLQICVFRLIAYVDGLLVDEIISTDKNYLQTMTYGALYATKHLVEVVPECADKFHMQPICMQMERIWRLQVEYGLFHELNDVTTQESCWKILHLQMENLLSEQSSPKSGGGDNGKKTLASSEEQPYFDIHRLGDVLGLPGDEVTGRLAVRIAEKNETFKAAEICLELSSNYSKTAPVLLNVVQHFYENLGAIQDGVSPEMLQAIYETITRATAYCEIDILSQCLAVASWTSLLCSLCALDAQASQQISESKYQDWQFSNFYQDRGLRIERHCYLPQLVAFINLACFRKNEMEETDHSTLLTLLRQVIFHLRSKGQEVAALQVLLLATVTILEKQLVDSFHEDEVLSIVRSVHYDIVKALLSRIVNRNVVDNHVALDLLYSLENRSLQCFKELMNTCGGEFGRLMSITAVGVAFGQMVQIPKLVHKCQKIHKNASWGGRLAQFHISLKDIQSLESTENVWRVLRDLFLCSAADVCLVLQFCQAFGVDRDRALFEYLQSILLGAKMQDWSLASEEKASNIMMVLMSKAKSIIEEFTDKSELLRCLKEIAKKLNSYCYEAVEFVLINLLRHCSNDDEIKVGADKGLGLIRFLNLYKRASPPSGLEMDLWLANENQHDQLPRLASIRLPFYPLLGQDMWKIVTGELTSDVIDNWLSVSSLLGLDHDQLIVVSVQNTFTKWMAKTQSQPDAANQTGYQLMEVLQGLGIKISSSKVATACSVWVLKRLPIGPTKVQVARLSMVLAKRWATESKDEESRESLRKFTRTYHRLAVEQVLHDYGFTDPEYFALSQKPAELITYMLENSTSGQKIFTSYYSKSLHSAVKEISAIGECHLGDLCNTLLDKWLPHPEAIQTTGNETVTLNFNWANVTTFEEKDNMGTNLNRTINLLQYAPLEDSILEQLSVILKDSPTATNLQKVQALRCLFVVADDKTIEQVSGQESGSTWKMLNELMFVVRLEAINLPYTLEMFRTWNKGHLVESILQSHSRTPKALLLASSLCMQYEMWDEPFWDPILNGMIQMQMSVNLQSVLFKLSSKSFLWHNSAFIAAWNCVLKAILQREPLSADVDNQALNTYFKLMSCPCITDLDLDFFISEFRSQGSLVPAVACALLKPKLHTNVLPTPKLCSEIREKLAKVRGLKHRLLCFSQVSQFAGEDND